MDTSWLNHGYVMDTSWPRIISWLSIFDYQFLIINFRLSVFDYHVWNQYMTVMYRHVILWLSFTTLSHPSILPSSNNSYQPNDRLIKWPNHLAVNVFPNCKIFEDWEVHTHDTCCIKERAIIIFNFFNDSFLSLRFNHRDHTIRWL